MQVRSAFLPQMPRLQELLRHIAVPGMLVDLECLCSRWMFIGTKNLSGPKLCVLRDGWTNQWTTAHVSHRQSSVWTSLNTLGASEKGCLRTCSRPSLLPGRRLRDQSFLSTGLYYYHFRWLLPLQRTSLLVSSVEHTLPSFIFKSYFNHWWDSAQAGYTALYAK